MFDILVKPRKFLLSRKCISIYLAGFLAGVLLISIVFQARAGTNINLFINDKEVFPDVPLQITNGRVMVPLRLITEALGCDVRWDGNTRTVYVTTKNIDNPLGQDQGIPVIPNEGIVTGTVLGYSVISSTLVGIAPSQTLYTVDIWITKSEDVSGVVNYLKNKVGQVIKAYSKEKLPADLFGKTITARVSYFGDEHNGKYWINHLNLNP